jgi:hypothetical protein
MPKSGVNRLALSKIDKNLKGKALEDAIAEAMQAPKAKEVNRN